MVWAVLLLVAAFLLTAALTGAARRSALARSVMDVPNARSSHAAPMPKGGGPAMMLVFFGATVVAYSTGHLPGVAVASVLAGGLLVGGVGLWDDLGNAPIRWRLLAHAVAAIIAVAALGGLPALPLWGLTLEWGAAGYVLGAMLTVWLLNLYNFMDGIDGIAGVELVTVCAGAALLLAWHGWSDAAWWLLLLGVCGLGFLLWNWPPAKIFMGDAGSGFLGFVLAVFALWTGGPEGIGLWAWGILLGVFLVDATWTLLRRLISRQRVYEAHRSHTYQIAARRFGGHAPVTISVGLINVFWLLPLAALASLWPAWGLAFLLIAWLPLVLTAWWFRAGCAEA